MPHLTPSHYVTFGTFGTLLSLVCACTSPPSSLDASTVVVAPDAVTPDAVTPDAVTPDAVTPDAVTPDAVTPDAGPWGLCGRDAYRALCDCTSLTDTAALAQCQQRIYSRFPACLRCLTDVLSQQCCDVAYRAIMACANAHHCSDRACTDAQCPTESMDYLHCQATAQALPYCQLALHACISDFPRLHLCDTAQ